MKPTNPKTGRKKRRKKERTDQVARRIRQYRERNRILAAMGYATYLEYLRSDLWKGIRDRILLDQPECHVCKGVANQVHHLSYTKDVMEGTNPRQLVGLCGSCHRRIEYRDRDREKLNVSQAGSKMRQLARATGRAQGRETGPFTSTKILSARGLSVGDKVMTSRGVHEIAEIRHSNHLPQFLVGGRWVGRTKIRSVGPKSS